MTNKFENGLFIFRRDLRIVDNNGLNLLNEKCKNIFTIFIFTPEQVGSGNKYKSDNSVQFMIESLQDLASQISKSGGHLYTFYGHNDKIVADCIKAFDINVVCFNLDISPYAKERDEKIIKLCEHMKTYVMYDYDYYLHQPGTIVNGSGEPYQKFTPYYNAALKKKIESPAGPRKIHFKRSESHIPGKISLEQAFLQGAGFNPATASRGAIQQRGQYDYLRAIGRTAGEAINQAGNFLGQWTNIASSYIADPTKYGALQYQYGMGAANVGLQKIDTRRQMLSDLYTAQIGGSEAQQQMGQRQYARQQELNAANFARDTTYAKGVGDIAKAASSAAMSGAGAYGQYATAKGAGGGFPGGFDYTKAYGSATYGGASPGFGNFDYGSGTGA